MDKEIKGARLRISLQKKDSCTKKLKTNQNSIDGFNSKLDAD